MRERDLTLDTADGAMDCYEATPEGDAARRGDRRARRRSA